MTTSISAPDACCPITLGEVCWDSGAATGRAWAVYDPADQSTQFLDQLTGDPVAANFIVACADADSPFTNAVATVSHTVATAAGNVAANAESVTFTNVGTTAGVVAGAAIQPGESITFSGYTDPVARQFKKLPQIAYTASATAILSISTVI